MYNGWALHQGWKKLMLNAERPIGIFDSGLGGLSVLRTALRMLPEPYREVFSMRVFGELSFRQIGAVFGKTEHWACVTFHRARQKLKSIVE